jgi:hypothetical protein
MKRKNNELKMLANLAKHRLMSADYQNVKSSDAVVKQSRSASSYFIKNARAMRRLKADAQYVTIKDGTDDDFVKSVVSILSSDIYVTNPLGRLVDREYFHTLGDVEKQSYILRLSDKYTKVKSMFDNHELDALMIS